MSHPSHRRSLTASAMLRKFMQDSAPPYRIVIASPNAWTRFGGEAILPVHYFRILRARGADVHLVAHARNREDLIEQFGDVANLSFVEDTAFHRLADRCNASSRVALLRILAYNASALWTEWLQRRRIARLVSEVPRAIVHVPTPVSPRAVSLIGGLPAPVVFGPMNGGMTYPPGHSADLGPRQERIVALGRMAAGLANRLLPAKRRAARLIVANERTAGALPMRRDDRVMTLVENGVRTDEWIPSARLRRRPEDPFRLVFMGRLVGWKAVDVTLRALAGARAAGVLATLDVVGDGPERAALEALVREMGIGEAVVFHGFQPQAKAAAILRERDALILNSLIECGGAVVLEAMACGLPVIASAWGGPLDYLDASCGLLVHPSPPESFADRLAQAIATIAADPARARRMGEAGRARVLADFDWDRKVDRIIEIFDCVLAPVPTRAIRARAVARLG